MGRVWRAQDEVLGRAVAVKELTAALYAAEEDRVLLTARTQKEARAAARINHPAVVTVHDVLEFDDRPWIVMELVDGCSLADRVKESGALAPEEAARIGRQVLAALRAAHTAGVVHRDVKPGNVLLARDGRVMLTDFGIAQLDGDSTITRTGEIVGSVDYLAPERIRGDVPAPASDLWALGATLYTAVEGRSPFRRTSPLSTMQAVVMEEAERPERAGVLGPVIEALLRKEPADRPSADEAEQMLAEAAEGRRPAAAQAYVPTQVIQDPERAVTRPYGGFRDGAGDPAAAGGPGGSGGRPGGSAGNGPGGGVSRRGNWRTVLAVVVVAALVGGGAAFGVVKFAGRDGGADAGVEAGAEAGGSSASAQPSPGASEKDGPPAHSTPDGWTRVTDEAGFSLLLPEGWARRTDGGQIDYTPDGGDHLLRIGIDPDPDFGSAHPHLLDIERQTEERLPDYRRVQLTENTFRDREGALWEFTWTETKTHPGQRRAIDQVYFADGTEYAIYMTGPADDWDRTREQFETVLRGWSPDARPAEDGASAAP
ncbi:protein kinase [Streptomyces sp. GC420]|nr:protein kinase [Streptomyces sp. GC420]